ncbi:MAG: 16S rRNA (cytosine(1402)-N(4))-methyltransferase RsmH [Candidatus Sungbacteria bacterium]|uniref:Ribosomal RNA small subunit methyltransferase H n=1 Tax=Candidatus Sungiibacteriota bacterium TaxID=2750080 RepID=A0A9D6DSG9_9BACT|nr:16S rRNA (cytosine(1402)-N(4))-methyltransferase RsmH [Candidatus Sungbacteria bacterium]
MIHQPVLLQEVIHYLDPQPNEDFIDATFGGGGHAAEILKRTAPNGKLLGIDLDPQAGSGLETRSENLTASEPLVPRRQVGGLRSGIEPGPYQGRLFLECGNFADIAKISSRYFPNGVDGVLFDFGFSTDQLEKSGRGFTYLKDEPLDMRYYQGQTLVAEEIVNKWPEKELEKIFKEFGEERQARRIAKNIAAARKIEKIITTSRLVAVMGSKDIKTIARIFQALRIAVNNELENIRSGLVGAWQILKPEGRLAAIAFHSLEDRIVKTFFNEKKQAAAGSILTKKPVTATAAEINQNSKSRSAKLRVIRKLGVSQ